MKRIDKIVIMFFRIFFVIIIIYSIYNICNWKIGNDKNNKIKNEINEIIKNSIEDNNMNFDEIKKINNDSVAYLKVNNTNIDYVVVKASDNDYYLNHNLKKEYNQGGWPFMDYRNRLDESDKNIIIYGHNMLDGSMFGSLKNMLKKDWYENKDNLNIEFITEKKKYNYKIFSIYNIEKEDYYISTVFKNDKEYKEFLNKLKSRSVKDFNVLLDENTKILTLSTCSSNGKRRVVVHAKLEG